VSPNRMHGCAMRNYGQSTDSAAHPARVPDPAGYIFREEEKSGIART